MTHYTRWRAGADLTKPVRPRNLPLADRIAAGTRSEGDCLIWTGDLSHNGYAQIKWKGKCRRLARLLMEQTHGPSELMVLHHPDCTSRACVAMEHLRYGTAAENAADRDARRAA
jgi:hypothetical protein